MTPALRSLLFSAPLDASGAAMWVEPDEIIIDDVQGPAALRLFAGQFGARGRVARPERVRVVSTIDLEGSLPDRLAAHNLLREFARESGSPFIHESSACEQGCSAAVEAEPGSLIASARRPDAGAAAGGCITITAQALDLAGALASGRMWAARPRVQRLRLEGALRAGRTAHDLAIVLRPLLGAGSWTAIDWPDGRGAAEARSLCALLLGDSPAQSVFVLREAIDEPFDVTLRLDEIEPMLGDAERARPAADAEPTDVDRVYIGSCTTGSVADLRLAAEVLAGGRVHVPTVIAPASARDVSLLKEEKLADGGPSLATVFEQAGCDLGLPGCAACVNALGDMQQEGRKGETLTVVATAAANVSTRRVARVLTASPITAAQIALRGRL